MEKEITKLIDKIEEARGENLGTIGEFLDYNTTYSKYHNDELEFKSPNLEYIYLKNIWEQVKKIKPLEKEILKQAKKTEAKITTWIEEDNYENSGALYYLQIQLLILETLIKDMKDNEFYDSAYETMDTIIKEVEENIKDYE